MPDVVVIGAGIAGLSAAAELASDCSVRVLEMERTPAHHASGRSAALLIPSYGPPDIRRLTRASLEWFHTAGHGQSEVEVISHRYIMYASDEASLGHLHGLIDVMGDAGGHLELIDAAETRRLCPALRSDWVMAGAVDDGAHDMDVAAIIDVYRRALHRRGGRLDTDHKVTALNRTEDGWDVVTTGGDVSCDVVVNAAGAWVDAVAATAGIRPLGFEPKRRTIAISKPEAGADPGEAFVADAGEEFYFGREAGGLLLSPADATPSEACDAKPEQIDIAYAIDRINTATDLGLRTVTASWAGLRTFSPDGEIVIGPDPTDPTFIWCGGQGGYGIHTCPAAARATAAIALGNELPDDLTATGLTTRALSPARF